MSLVLRRGSMKLEALEPEEDFEEIEDEDLEKQLASDPRQIKPLTDELRKRLTTVKPDD